MLVSAVILCLLVILLITVYYSRKFVRIVGIYFLVITANLIVGTLYLSKASLYSSLYSADYWLYSHLNQFKLSLTTIVRLFNLTFSAYMLSAVLLIRYLRKISIFKIALLTLAPIYFYCFNDPGVARSLWVELHTSQGMKQVLIQGMMSASNLFNRSMLILYMFLPVVMMLFLYRRTIIFVVRKDIIISSVCITLINCFVFFFLIRGIYSNIMFDKVNMAKLPYQYTQQAYSAIVPIVMWVTIFIVVLLMISFRPFEVFDTGRSFVKRREWKQLNQNLSMILHSYKNAFLGISQQFTLAQLNMEKGNYEKALLNTQQGQKITVEHMKALENTLCQIRSVNVEFVPVDLMECIRFAVNKVLLQKQVSIEVDYSVESVLIRGDRYHLTETILNFLVNAVQAMDEAKGESSRIRVSTYVEDNLVLLEIWDNGIGIKKENLRKIFQPFFSTKSVTSGGVGLNYALNIIRQHHGNIRVKSVPGEYTSFQIVFPVYTKKKKWLYK